MPSPSLGWPRHRGFMGRAITQGRWGSCIVHNAFTQGPFTVLPILCSSSKCGQLELSSLVMFRAIKTSFRRAKLQKSGSFAQNSHLGGIWQASWQQWSIMHYALCIIHCANSSGNLRSVYHQGAGSWHYTLWNMHYILCNVHRAFSIVYCALSNGHVVMSIVQCACIVHCENEIPMGNGNWKLERRGHV